MPFATPGVTRSSAPLLFRHLLAGVVPDRDDAETFSRAAVVRSGKRNSDRIFSSLSGGNGGVHAGGRVHIGGISCAGFPNRVGRGTHWLASLRGGCNWRRWRIAA